MFESLRARIEQYLAQHTAPADRRAFAAQMQEAVVEAKVSVSQMREALVITERELTLERKALADAERRGRLAAEVPDQETVVLAERFAEKHRSRSVVLERKLSVQKDELVLAEREVAEMTAQLRSAKQGQGAAAASGEAAWREIQSVGGARPDTDLAGDLLGSNLDRAAHESAAEAQLAHLKKKMGKNPTTESTGDK